ncbi:MAG: winged helix-turn-helix domain-containing protein [Methanosarcinaceae archaeon]|nr:winged helix-turn-helix domain-containing protein [Methanosarcinaceae archaeon]
MDSALLNLIFFSEKRKDLLLFLKTGPKTLEEIKETLSITSVSILPQLKKLKEKQLIIQQNKNYELTLIGKVIIEKMESFIDTCKLFEENFEYWSEINLQEIPIPFRKRLGELGKCTLKKPDLNHMFELNREFVAELFKSDYVFSFVAYFHPAFASVYTELAEKGTEIAFLLTEKVFQRFKIDYREVLIKLLSFNNIKMFIHPDEIKIAGLTVTDRFLLLSLFPKKGHFDRESLMCHEAKSLLWGKELFDYLLEKAKEVEKV